ncbi:MAG TPA: type VII secretion protein EccCb, partial [Micromonosporaceae bacterium]
IALRTFSTAESRAAIGSADAADLPATPGHGFLKVGSGGLVRFKAGYVSGPGPGRPGTHRSAAPRVLAFSTAPSPAAPLTAEPAPAAPVTGTSLLDVLVDRLSGHGSPAHRVWLPPLAEPPGLDQLLGGLAIEDGSGVVAADPAVRGRLRTPVGLIDRPLEQRRDVAWLDLAGQAGHVAVIGGPQSGKSTAVRTIITGLALTHTPREVQVYCLDFGGGGLSLLRDLPQVGGVAGRLEPALVRRTVGELATLLGDRERRFARLGIESIVEFRRRSRSTGPRGSTTGVEDGFGDVFLVIDGWATLRNEYEDLEPAVVDLATRGLSYGIHVVATALRWFDLRAAANLFGSRLELRLGDPGESAVNRRAAGNVPAAAPGRGLTMDGLHLLTALPQATGHTAASLVKAIAAGWTGPRAPVVRMLPPVLPYAHLLAGAEDGELAPLGTGWSLPIGIAEADLRPVLLDFAAEPHLMAFGDSESGKTSLLRSLAESIVRRYRPEQARIVLVDYRRGLLGAVATEHLIGYGSSAENTGPLLASVASYLDQRRPGDEVTPDQLRSRTWWSGPDCFVLVDDYDLVAAGTTNPVLPLLAHLAQARDVGLHLVLTRRAGGAARALYEPVLQRLRELGTPGLVLAGDRDEGALVGTVRPGPQPPGRGWLVTRRHGTQLVQLAYLEP